MRKSGLPDVRSSRTISVQWISSGAPSRSISSPVVWSICASMRMIARTAVSRIARAGWSSGAARNCARRSGEALNSTQSVPSAETAIDDCVRGRARIVPLRTPSQFGQLQFHCGKPPPAAEPSTLMCISAFVRSQKDESPAWGLSPGAHRSLAGGDVHRHLEAETHLGVFRLGPHAVDTSFPLRPDSDRPAARAPTGKSPDRG